MPETQTKPKKPRLRPRQFVMVELTDAQMAKLNSRVEERARKTGIKQTKAGIIRELIMGGK